MRNLFLVLLIACGGGAPVEPAAPVPPEAPEAPEVPPAPAVPDAATEAGAAAVHDWPGECPDPTSDRVRYQHESYAEREICQRIRFHCDPGWTLFSGECGCGCTQDE